MGSIADKLNKLLQTKAAIKQAIINKGVSAGDNFSTYPELISQIPTGIEANTVMDSLCLLTGTNSSSVGGKTRQEYNFANPPVGVWATIYEFTVADTSAEYTAGQLVVWVNGGYRYPTFRLLLDDDTVFAETPVYGVSASSGSYYGYLPLKGLLKRGTHCRVQMQNTQASNYGLYMCNVYCTYYSGMGTIALDTPY